MYIPRRISAAVMEAAKYYPVIILTGPRQTGKTTLAKNLFESFSFTNLEEADTRAFAKEDINAFLDNLGDNAIIDEVQNLPEILSSIQARVDKDKSLRYILTGSNNFSLMHNASQSLAGRAALFEVLPFAFDELSSEVNNIETSELLWRGLYPGVIADRIPPYIFYRNYYSTYIERDVRGFAQIQNIDSFQKFMKLTAARTATEYNKAAVSVEVGVSAPTINSWLSVLKASYIVYTLPPYFANISKRLTKTPKLYFYDTGLLCYLLGIEEYPQLTNHPLKGAVPPLDPGGE